MTKKRMWRAAAIAAAVLLGVLLISRNGSLTICVPFSGRVFDIDPERVDVVFIQNGTTGEQYFFATPEEKTAVAARLNNLRHGMWFPVLPVARGGWSFRVAIGMDGRQYSYTFNDNSMLVNHIVFWFPGGQLETLREYVE